MKNKIFFKRIIAIFVVLVMAFTGGFMQVMAEELPEKEVRREYTVISEIVELPKLETDAFNNIGFFAINRSNPTITDTNEVLWFDRLANKPNYASEFYSWLANNSGPSGALVTATELTLQDSTQVHKVTTFTGSKGFTFSYGASETTINNAAVSAIADELNVNFSVSSKWINEMYACFDRDFPEVFWLSGGSATMTSTGYELSYNRATCKGTVKYEQTVYFVLKSDSTDVRESVYTNGSYIRNDIAERQNSITLITTAVDGKTDYEKIKYFNNYLTVNNGYNANIDTAYPQAWECISALQGLGAQKAPVCEGYARAFKVLCDAEDIPCVLVSGYSGGPHMWNNVCLDGQWYAVDVTWNDPGRLKEGYPQSGNENENYLLVGENTKISGETFNQSHIVNNTVFNGGVAYINGPLLSRLSYRESPHKCTHKDCECIICKSVCFDVNQDDAIDILDYVRLKIAVLQQETTGNFDCNDDGVFNAFDITLMKKKIWLFV